MFQYLYLDFETGSEADIKKVGGYVYAKHPSTHIQCLGLSFEGKSGYLTGFDLKDIGVQNLKMAAEDPEIIFVAHNAFFDRTIWEEILVKKFGLPSVSISRWKCTMAKCLASGLPGSLEEAAKALKLKVQKDMQGSAVMRKLSRPRRITKNNKEKFWTRQSAPTSFERLDLYCLRDIDVMIDIDKAVRDLSFRENIIWQIDQRINSEGVRLDMEAVTKAIALADENKRRLLVEFKDLTGISSPTLRAKHKLWLRKNGVEVLNMKAPTLKKVLEENQASYAASRSIEISQELNRTSLAKLSAMLLRSFNGQLRELFQYHGAHPGRWAGRGVQLHNLKRAQIDIDMDAFIADVKKFSYEIFEFIYGDVHDVLSSGIRGMIIPDEGKKLVIADLKQIEARVLTWLADDNEKLELYRQGEDLYVRAAVVIYDTKDIDKNKRAVGKVSELALGYQGGIGAFVKMGSGYDLDLMPIYPTIWGGASFEERENADSSYDYYCRRFKENQKKNKKYDEEMVSREIGFTADIIKQRWRLANPKIVKFWKQLNDTAIKAVETGLPVQCGKVRWFMDGFDLHCKLPSGRILTYPDAYLSVEGRKKTVVYYGKDPKTTKRTKVFMYGGKWAENITQGVARDILSEAMARLEPKYPVYFHVHDEAVSQVPIRFNFIQLSEFKKLLLSSRKWTKGLPIDVDIFEAMRYRK
jgi:DNA polymerase